MKKILLILLLPLILLVSGCKLIKGYIPPSIYDILDEKGYKLFESDRFESALESFIYKWTYNETKTKVLSPKGSMIKKENDSISIFSPSSYNYTINKSENLEENDKVRVYTLDDYFVIIIENKYVYALSKDKKNIYVNEGRTRRFTFIDEDIYIDCLSLLSGLEEKETVNTFFFNKPVFKSEKEDEFDFYVLNYYPKDFSMINYELIEVDKSYLKDPVNNSIYYAVSNSKDVLVKIEFDILGREEMPVSHFIVLDNKERRIENGTLTLDTDWNSIVKEKLDSLDINLPFFRMGDNYTITSEEVSNGFKGDFSYLNDKCYIIYDYYCVPTLERYKDILENNGFSLYELFFDLENKEDMLTWNTNYNVWISSGENKYYDTYISSDERYFIKLSYDLEKGNMIQIYKSN